MTAKNLFAFSAIFVGLALSASAEEGPAPVLVELFTSQGCSSCPPAENWLNREGMELFKQGKIIPLAFHVDYWDNLGWKDPFSANAFTTRQTLYTDAFHDQSLYTPEMVVSGRAGFVGSDGGRALQEITDPKNQTGSFPLSFTAQKTSQELQLTIHTGQLGKHLKVWVAVFQNNLVTQVKRGENAGEELTENFVVKILLELKKGSKNLKVNIPWEPAWIAPDMGAAVFVQDDLTMEVKAVRGLLPIP